MAGVTIKKVSVLNNPAPFTEPFQFEITYEAVQDLDDDLEWKVSYLSSPSDASFDQELENVLVGPIASGVYKFILEADAPDGTKVPLDDLIGTTGVVLSCSFHDQEFIRVGFYIYVDYEDEELRDNPPETAIFEKLIRNVANDDPRITTRPLNLIPMKEPESEKEEASKDPLEQEEPTVQVEAVV